MAARWVRIISSIGFALLLQLGAGGSVSMAQSYSFTFTGNGCGGCAITNGIANVIGGSVHDVSFYASGFATAPLSVLSGSTTWSSISGTSNQVTATSLLFQQSGYPAIQLFIDPTNNAMNTSTVEYLTSAGVVTQTINGTATMAPAPVPGAGTLSWLVLGLGVAIIRRKSISAALRSAYARIAGRAAA